MRSPKGVFCADTFLGKLSFFPDCVLLFYFMIWVLTKIKVFLDKTTSKLFISIYAISVLGYPKGVFLAIYKGTTKFNLMSGFLRDRKVFGRSWESKKLLFLPKRNLRYHIFRCEGQTTWISNWLLLGKHFRKTIFTNNNTLISGTTYFKDQFKRTLSLKFFMWRF